MSITEIIAALEAATGPDRKLDAEVGRAVGVQPKMRNVWKRNLYPSQLLRVTEEWPAYTASIDAALTLVPEGWRVSTADWSIAGRYTWMLTGPKTEWITSEDGYPAAGRDWHAFGVSLATPALALCIAALRAREDRP